MRVACCCDGSGTAMLVRRALTRLNAIETLSLLYCIDAGMHDDVRLAQGGILGRGRLGEWHDAQLSAAEEERAAAVLQEAAAAALAAGYQGDVQTFVMHGRPEREIVRVLAEIRADVVVLYPRPPERQCPPGPKSVGHVARFIVDHAPCDVLLARGT